MDSREKEARDHRFEEFVLEQVKRYGDMEAKVSKVYIGCAVACIAMCVLGIVMGKPFFKCLFIGIWSIGFWASKLHYEEDAKEVGEAAKKYGPPLTTLISTYPTTILKTSWDFAGLYARHLKTSAVWRSRTALSPSHAGPGRY